MKITVAVLCLFALFSCQSNLSQETKEKIKEKESFWKARSEAINNSKTDLEYPIKKDTTITEQRRYQLYLTSMDCSFEIFIDDVFLTKFIENGTTKRGGYTGNIDLNHLLLTSGTHEIKVLMYPKYGKKIFDTKGILNIKLYYYLKNNFKENFYTTQLNANNGIELSQSSEQWMDKWDQQSQVGYDGSYVSKKPSQLKGLAVYEWRTTFEADVPFNFASWLNSVNLEKEKVTDKKDIRKEVVAEYVKIHKILSNKSSDEYLSIVGERENIFKSCLFYDKNEKTLQRIEFDELMKNDDYVLEPLYEETFQLEFQSYGKLVNIFNKADGESIADAMIGKIYLS
ncbi:hypothetical protein FNW52_19515 [Flavobacterium sp. ZT3R18]|uniref:hypothetical protein n=1 Tax=Flavobacterium sp. ZT3R18 TaxID=2594429 RepID=UPI00117AC0B3|nr:hypothetical protein [Flavobacterium sp. ZT3R18]TRX30904.1 hypothetical protein FNW52_19515 [Flavobacterium sp. ZT3R18]